MFAISATTDLTAQCSKVSGWHLTENAGTPAAAIVNLRNGGATGTILARLKFAASETKSLAADRPLFFTKGLYVEVETGTVIGCVVPL